MPPNRKFEELSRPIPAASWYQYLRVKCERECHENDQLNPAVRELQNPIFPTMDNLE